MVEYTMGRVTIDRMSPASGRLIKEDDTTCNIADAVCDKDLGVYVRLADSPQLDAFGRMRTSSPNTLFDAQQEYGVDAVTTWDMLANNTYAPVGSDSSVSDAGSSVGPRNINTRLTPVTAAATNGAKAVLQSRQYVRYIPGKSQFIAITGVFADSADDSASFVLRSSTSGSPVPREFQQADWSMDKFDGFGPSGVLIDFTKTQILLIDAQWLAVGRLRVGFDIEGQFYVAHEYRNANNLTVPYTQTFNLPVRMEAITDATGTSLQTGYFDSANGAFLKMRTPTPGGTSYFMCCSVQSEGGVESRGFPRGVSNGTTGRDITARTAVLAIRPKLTYNGITNRSHAEVIDYISHVAGNNDCSLEIIQGGTVAGGTWVSVSPNSTVEYNITGTTVTGGERLRSGYSVAGAGGRSGSLSQGQTDIRNPFVLSKIDDAAARQFALAVVMTPFTGTATCRAALNWNEQTI